MAPVKQALVLGLHEPYGEFLARAELAAQGVEFQAAKGKHFTQASITTAALFDGYSAFSNRFCVPR